MDTTRKVMKKVRTEKGITYRQLSDETGISPTRLHRIESGSREPYVEEIQSIFTALLNEDEKNNE